MFWRMNIIIDAIIVLVGIACSSTALHISLALTIYVAFKALPHAFVL